MMLCFFMRRRLMMLVHGEKRLLDCHDANKGVK